MPYKDPIKQKQALARHYKKNKQLYRVAAAATRVRRINKVNTLKSVPCVDCGVQYPPYIMQFDHTQPGKVDSISRLVRRASMPAVLAEIAKCEVVCANCHASRTYNRGVA
jgi:hypothetical protein